MNGERENEARSAAELVRALENRVEQLDGDRASLRAQRESVERGFLSVVLEGAPLLARMLRRERRMDEAVESLRASLGKLASLDEPPSPDCRAPRCGVR